MFEWPEKTQLFGIFWDISSLCFCLRDMLKEPKSSKTKIEEGRVGIQKYLKKLANDQRISRVYLFLPFFSEPKKDANKTNTKSLAEDLGSNQKNWQSCSCSSKKYSNMPIKDSVYRNAQHSTFPTPQNAPEQMFSLKQMCQFASNPATSI